MPIDLLDPVALTHSSDQELLAAHAAAVVERRCADAKLAAAAGEIARRSAPDAGMAGLARQTGDRTPAKLIERTAGVGADEAHRLIAVGSRVASTSDPVGNAVRAGTLSVTAASAITSQLDHLLGDVSPEDRRAAEIDLIAAGAVLPITELRKEAKAYRDALDVAGVPEREERLYRQRRLTLTRLESGMTRIEGLLDPESAALVQDAFDQVLSPRRGGPRFVDPADVAQAERLVSDPRTNEQLMVDTLVQMVHLAGQADEGELFGTRTPVVRLHVTTEALESGSGVAVLEGQEEPVSIATAERSTCSGVVEVTLDREGRVLNLGREQRLYSKRQRVALAARDGGCLAPGCDRPPSWCEAHHGDEWSRHRGRTDVDRGILLCRYHHRWVHTHPHTRIVPRVIRRGGSSTDYSMRTPGCSIRGRASTPCTGTRGSRRGSPLLHPRPRSSTKPDAVTLWGGFDSRLRRGSTDGDAAPFRWLSSAKRVSKPAPTRGPVGGFDSRLRRGSTNGGTPPPRALWVPSRRPRRASSGRRSRLRRGSTNGGDA